jgi:hypothetical protein
MTNAVNSGILLCGLLLYGLLFSASVASAAPPEPLPAPDYTQRSAWAAWPGQASHADDVPAGVARGGNPAADVFFIHPTTYLSTVIANAPFDAGGETGARIDDAVLRFQASVFNACCRIYAPRYRQASLRAITTNTPEAYAATDLAYHDVFNAFDAFLRTNPDRPFIIASHSQGSIHALRLLQERVIGTPLQRRLVAAYIIGTSLPRDIAQRGLPVCQSAAAIGCVITWNSVRSGRDDRRRKQETVTWWDGHYQPIAGRPMVCVNPLNWLPDGIAAAAANLGAVYSDGRRAPIPAPVENLTGAACENGLLGIDIPVRQRRHFGDLLTVTGIYHDFDYGLFYMNIRANALERSRAWAARGPSAN